MEWILSGILIPIIICLYTIYRDRKNDASLVEARFSSIESRITISEQQLSTLQKDVGEIEKIVTEITELKISIAKILTILEERSK